MCHQIWNHTFYWNSLTPNGGGTPQGKILEAINKSFGSFEEFKKKFTEEAVNHFGSGWAWLVRDDNNNVCLFISFSSILLIRLAFYCFHP